MNDWSNDWIFLTIDFMIVSVVTDRLTDRLDLGPHSDRQCKFYADGDGGRKGLFTPNNKRNGNVNVTNFSFNQKTSA